MSRTSNIISLLTWKRNLRSLTTWIHLTNRKSHAGLHDLIGKHESEFGRIGNFMWVRRQAGLPKYFRLKCLDQVKHKADFFCFFYSINPNKMSLDVTPVLTSCKTATHVTSVYISWEQGWGIWRSFFEHTIGKAMNERQLVWFVFIGGLNTRQGNRYTTNLRKKTELRLGSE